MNYIINFSAFCLPLLLFNYWGIVGYATLSVLRSQRHTMQNLLLAPVTGFSITLLLTFTINRLGFPISQFATWLFSVLLIGSSIIIYYKKPIFTFRFYFPFYAILLLSLCLIGSPLLKFGYDWISYGNDDMANYALGAMRFLNYGYFDIPVAEDLLQRKDFSLLYWFWHVPGIVRSGSEVALASIAGLTHLNPIQIFMPTIVAFHLMLISATGAIAYTSKQNHNIALTICLILSFSALTALGTFYQLITQVLGLSLLIACATLICQSFTNHRKFYVLKESLLISLLLSVLLIVYVELIPFLAATYLIFIITSFLKGWRPSKALSFIVLLSLILLIIFTNTYFIAALEFIVREYTVMADSDLVQTVIFPYFLLPSGLANLWGFLGLTAHLREPFLSLSIISGLIFTILVTLAAIRLIIVKRSIPAIVLLVMMCLAVNLFRKNYGFGLFKLAMYVQPFLISVFIIATFEYIKKTSLKKIIILSFLLINAYSMLFYLERSKGKTPGAFTEVAYGSYTKLNHEYRNLIAHIPKDAVLLSDDFNISLIKFQALQSVGKKFIPLTSPSNFIVGQIPDSIYMLPTIHSQLFHSKEGRELAKNYSTNGFYKGQFNLQDKNHTRIEFVENEFCSNKHKFCKDGYIVADTGLRSIFNKRHNVNANEKKHNFMLKKMSDTKNHLVFIDSSQGRVYHSLIANNMDNLSLFNLESDPMYSHQNMQAVGRYLLMKVFNPTEKVRMVINLTNTFGGDGKNTLPMLTVIGNSKVKLPIIGRGSARVFSEPLSPQTIKGMSYFATDINADPIVFPSERKGIMGLYNKKLHLDLRSVVTFVRDISLISDSEYKKLSIPSQLNNFPQDLANQDLIYSGIYEDGWFSENAYVQLKQLPGSHKLMIEGMLPKIESDFEGSTLEVLVDNKKVTKQKIQPGEFKIAVPVGVTSRAHKIELHFSAVQKLPYGDNRPIGAQIKAIRFA